MREAQGSARSRCPLPKPTPTPNAPVPLGAISAVHHPRPARVVADVRGEAELQAHACCVRQARTCCGTVPGTVNSALLCRRCRALPCCGTSPLADVVDDAGERAVDAHGLHGTQSDATAHSGGGAVRRCPQRSQGGGGRAAPTHLALQATARLRRGRVHAAEGAARRACARGAIPSRSATRGTCISDVASDPHPWCGRHRVWPSRMRMGYPPTLVPKSRRATTASGGDPSILMASRCGFRKW